MSSEGGTPSVVVSDLAIAVSGGLEWLRDGRLVYIGSGASGASFSFDDLSVWGITTDSRTGSPSGKQEKMIHWSGAFPFLPSASKDGRRMIVEKGHYWHDIYVGELGGNGTRLDSTKRFTSSESENFPTTWTRENLSILFTSDRTGRYQLFKQRLDADDAELLVQSSDDVIGAEFSPDAAWILYISSPHGGNSTPTSQRLMRLPASGGSPEQILEIPVDPMNQWSCSSRITGSCVISLWAQGQLIFYVLDPLHGQGKEVIRTQLGHRDDLNWDISPDGSLIAIGLLPGRKVRLLDLRNGTERDIQLSMEGIVQGLCWSADGNALFAGMISSGHQIIRVDLDGKTHVLLDRKGVWVGSLALSPDGRHLAYSQQTIDSNLWLLENF